MARKHQPFVVSVERLGERGKLTGFETVELPSAKAEAERRYSPGVCTVAVMCAGKIVDVFDGRWASDERPED